MMQKCGNCIWHDDNAICKNPDALMEGCVMDDLSWCAKYKRKKAEGCADRKMEQDGRMSECVVRMERVPKNCDDGCWGSLSGECPWCDSIDEYKMVGNRPPNCPIIAVLPEGHGRLGDLDALADDVRSLWDYKTVDGITATTVLNQTLTDIGNCPTIVPAERSET